MNNSLYIDKLGAGFRRIMTDMNASLRLSILAFEDTMAYWLVTVRRYDETGELVFDAGTKVGRYALKRITWRGLHDVVVHVNTSAGDGGGRVDKVIGVYRLNECGLYAYSTDPYVNGMLKRVAGQVMGLEVYLKEAERSAIETATAWELADKERARQAREDEARVQAELDAIAHPTIGGTQNGKVLLGLLRSEGPVSVAEDASVDTMEPEPEESGHRPGKKGGTRAKGRDGEDKPARGNKHAGGRGRKSHYPQMDDDVPPGALYH